MTDLEMVKRCAEKMGISGWLTEDDPMVTNDAGEFIEPYDPLHDDAQAMALVKKLELQIITGYENGPIVSEKHGVISAQDKSLLRAICTCVARMPCS